MNVRLIYLIKDQLCVVSYRVVPFAVNFLVVVNDMPLQVMGSCLFQSVDDECCVSVLR